MSKAGHFRVMLDVLIKLQVITWKEAGKYWNWL